MRWIVFLLLLTMLATGVSFAKYVTTVTGSGTVSVARPVVKYVKSDTALLNNTAVSWPGGLSSLKPGDTIVYQFAVQNFDGGLQNEVTMKYRLSLDHPGNTLPLDYTITSANAGTPVDGWYTIGFGGNATHTFTLTMTWPGSMNGDAYKNKQQPMSIRLEAHQVD